jgi:hypothetical protein
LCSSTLRALRLVHEGEVGVAGFGSAVLENESVAGSETELT